MDEVHDTIKNTSKDLNLSQEFQPDTLVDLISSIPDLKNVQTCNILLDHLESLKPCNFAKIPIEILRVIFTLCVESLISHKSELDGFMISKQIPMNIYASSIGSSLSSSYLAQYDTSLRPPIHSRSILLFKKLTKAAKINHHVHDSLRTLMLDFLSSETKRSLRDGVRKNYDIFDHFKSMSSQLDDNLDSSPIPSQEILDHNEPPEILKDLETEVISDSEEEDSIIDSNTSFATREVLKFQYGDIGHSEQDESSFVLLESMPHLEQSSRPSSTTKKQKLNPLTTKVFGEELFSIKLNKGKGGYSFWQLVKWCFYCLTKSSVHLFKNYYNILTIIIDTIWTDFLHAITIRVSSKMQKDIEILNDPLLSFQHLSARARKLTLRYLEEPAIEFNGCLLTNLLIQLCDSKFDRYDRLVEFTFTGLGETVSHVAPNPCYIKDNVLMKKNITDISTTQYLGLVSMNLRFKIIFLAYYRSLFFDDMDHDIESPHGLVDILSKKLNELNNLQLSWFFMANYEEFPTHCTQYINDFLEQLAYEILIHLCGEPLIEKYLSHDANDKIPDYSNILQLINDKDIYLSLIEDETTEGKNHFNDRWAKLLFILSWLCNNYTHNATPTAKPEIYELTLKADKLVNNFNILNTPKKLFTHITTT